MENDPRGSHQKNLEQHGICTVSKPIDFTEKKKLPHLNKDSNQRNFNSHYFYLLKFPLCYLKTSHLAGILSLIIPSA